MKNKLFAIALATALGACAPTMVAAPAGTFQAPSHIVVTLDHSWTNIPPTLNPNVNGSVLTRHGLPLDRVDLISIAPGEAIIRATRREQAPRYQANMSAPELVELVTSSLSRLGYTNIQTADVRPVQFVGAQGLRFVVSGCYESGLNLRGDVVLAAAKGKLNLMMFVAPAAHYYDANEGDFDHMVQSAHLS